MLEVIYIILSLIVLFITVVLILAAMKPDTFRVERSATINAAPEAIFPIVNDFHRWIEWSPWEKLDPNLKRTHGGPEQGTGATYAWEGNKKAGKGQMTITESAPASQIALKLDFEKPFEAHNNVEFTFTRQTDATHVNWAMHGQQPFLFKVMTVFMSMDKLVGKDFERGLVSLKSLAEERGAKPS
jgi:hypothetical protein